MNLFNDINTGAEFSQCGKFRYKLWRIWDESKPLVMCIGLNPSTANAIKPDPTITNLTKMLKILGYGGFYMTNLFAIISSKPEILLTCEDPFGNNGHHLAWCYDKCDEVIVCWGNFKESPKGIDRIYRDLSWILDDAKCFGTTKSGNPLHPLAMMYSGLTNEPKLSVYNVGIVVALGAVADFGARICQVTPSLMQCTMLN